MSGKIKEMCFDLCPAALKRACILHVFGPLKASA